MLQFPYRVQLLHAISSVARKGDYVECSNYFDIQRDSGMCLQLSWLSWNRCVHVKTPSYVSAILLWLSSEIKCDSGAARPAYTGVKKFRIQTLRVCRDKMKPFCYVTNI